MEITLFPSDKDPEGVRRTVSWEAFTEGLKTPRPADISKDALPMWSAAIFSEDYREDAGVEFVSALVYDVDIAPVPSLDDIRAAIPEGTWFAHTSSSSTSDAPRWRLVIALTRPVNAREYAALWQLFALSLPFGVGPQSKNPGRSWYAPRRGVDGSFTYGGST